MSGFQNNPAEFFHIARNPELVFVKDRDVVAFWPDMLQLNATAGMAIYRDDGKSSLLYETTSPQNVRYSERALLWARMSGDEIVGGLRWVPYITSNNVDNPDILPLREVISPRVIYERTTNTISLWFWTNVNQGYNGTVYDESELKPVLANNFSPEVPSPPNNAKRVLCYAIGEFYHAYVDGGVIDTYVSTAENITDERWDLVPVFTRPRILNWGQVEGFGAGVAVDGWYGTGAFGTGGVPGTGTGGGGEFPGGSGNIENLTGTIHTVTVVTSVTWESPNLIETSFPLTFFGSIGAETSHPIFTAVTCSGATADAGTGSKNAVVRTSKGWRGLSCIESPEVFFVDVLSVTHEDYKSRHAIDSMFREVVEQDTIQVVSAVPSRPIPIGVVYRNGFVFIETEVDVPMTINVTISGVRLGFKDRRFEEFTEEEANRNNRFWAKAYGDE